MAAGVLRLLQQLRRRFHRSGRHLHRTGRFSDTYHRVENDNDVNNVSWYLFLRCKKSEHEMFIFMFKNCRISPFQNANFWRHPTGRLRRPIIRVTTTTIWKFAGWSMATIMCASRSQTFIQRPLTTLCEYTAANQQAALCCSNSAAAATLETTDTR